MVAGDIRHHTDCGVRVKLAALLAWKLVDIAADYIKSRRLARQMQALRKAERIDTKYEAEVDAVLEGLGIIHHGGRNPTKRITLRPKPEVMVKASRETGA
jgi:hypothetical protein